MCIEGTDINEICIDEMKIMWKDIFGDGDEYLDAFFEEIYQQENTLVHKENGKVAAALYMIPYEMKYGTERFEVMYLYALSTDRQYRGKGIMSDLINKSNYIIKERGYAGSFLIPADEKLYGYYNKFGYTDVIYGREYIKTDMNEVCEEYTKTDIRELYEKYAEEDFNTILHLDNNRNIENRIILSARQNEFNCRTFMEEGGKIYLSKSKTEYIMMIQKENEVHIYDTNIKEYYSNERKKMGLFRKNTEILNDKYSMNELYIKRVFE